MSDELIEEPIIVTPEVVALIQRTIAEMRPVVQNDGGDIEFVAIEGNIVRVNLTGACTHCAMAGSTLGGLRRAIMNATGLPLRVAPAF
jgi:Fe-S cluster biogenesis protein NfuA